MRLWQIENDMKSIDLFLSEKLQSINGYADAFTKFWLYISTQYELLHIDNKTTFIQA